MNYDTAIHNIISIMDGLDQDFITINYYNRELSYEAMLRLSGQERYHKIARLPARKINDLERNMLEETNSFVELAVSYLGKAKKPIFCVNHYLRSGDDKFMCVEPHGENYSRLKSMLKQEQVTASDMLKGFQFHLSVVEGVFLQYNRN